ncbi:MAG: SDR family NAD(P)-dependent oxidoreductase [Pseudomonadota bacterium]
MSDDMPIAVVTGANRGLGRATVETLADEGFGVALTARSQEKADAAAGEIASGSRLVTGFAMDVTDTAQVRETVRAIHERFGKIDVVVNNAGIYVERDRPSTGLAVSPDVISETLDTNTLGPYRVLQAVLPILREQGHGRIINVSSQMARLATMNGGSPGYRMSKTALNALTTLVAAELGSDSGITINSVDPGWVQTDMGGPSADRGIAAGIDTIVWLARGEAEGNPTGKFFRDRAESDW